MTYTCKDCDIEFITDDENVKALYEWYGWVVCDDCNVKRLTKILADNRKAVRT